jgi:transcription initiation factor TFIIIB Brf1 subunit/transcription initiation factor TFIIB
VNLLASLSGNRGTQLKLIDEFNLNKRSDKESLFNLAQVFHINNSKISLDYINRFANSLNLPDDEEDRVASVLLKDLLTYENSM